MKGKEKMSGGPRGETKDACTVGAWPLVWTALGVWVERVNRSEACWASRVYRATRAFPRTPYPFVL